MTTQLSVLTEHVNLIRVSSNFSQRWEHGVTVSWHQWSYQQSHQSCHAVCHRASLEMANSVFAACVVPPLPQMNQGGHCPGSLLGLWPDYPEDSGHPWDCCQMAVRLWAGLQMAWRDSFLTSDERTIFIVSWITECAYVWFLDPLCFCIQEKNHKKKNCKRFATKPQFESFGLASVLALAVSR